MIMAQRIQRLSWSGCLKITVIRACTQVTFLCLSLTDSFILERAGRETLTLVYPWGKAFGACEFYLHCKAWTIGPLINF